MSGAVISQTVARTFLMIVRKRNLGDEAVFIYFTVDVVIVSHGQEG